MFIKQLHTYELHAVIKVDIRFNLINSLVTDFDKTADQIQSLVFAHVN